MDCPVRQLVLCNVSAEKEIFPGGGADSETDGSAIPFRGTASPVRQTGGYAVPGYDMQIK